VSEADYGGQTLCAASLASGTENAEVELDFARGGDKSPVFMRRVETEIPSFFSSSRSWSVGFSDSGGRCGR
jgi:hypothetical protein